MKTCLYLAFLWSGLYASAFAQLITPIRLSQMVVMSDSVHLATDIFLHPDRLPEPAILIRTAADRERYEKIATFFVSHGYHVIVQSTRGRFGSEGVDSLFFNIRRNFISDTHEMLEWIAARPWSNGRIGMFGIHDAGWIQYKSAPGSPEVLKAQYIISAPFHFHFHAAFDHGAPRQEIMENWVPQITAASLSDWFMDPLSFSRPPSPISGDELATVNIPVSHVTGWYDGFKEGNIAAFRVLSRKAAPFSRQYQRLIIGPWTAEMESIGRQEQGEFIFPQSAEFDVLNDALRWFDQWLKAKDTGVLLEPPVRYYLMGDLQDPLAPGNRWLYAADWPPPSKPVKFYLGKGGVLQRERKDKDETAEGIRYVPENPVPTVGGATVTLESGPFDQSTVELREDVLTFTSSPLERPLAIAGPVRVKLYAASDAVDTDFTAKLTDVYPNGRSILVADGIVRALYRKSYKKPALLTRNKVHEFWIELGHIAMVFNKGHRIRLAVSSSNAPKYLPNPNLPLQRPINLKTRIAINTIYYGGGKPSYLLLPVINLDDEMK